MADDVVTHEQIEHAFKPAADLIARLPTEGMDGYAGKRAAEALGVAENYAHQHREKIRPERTETVPALDASASMATGGLVTADAPFLVGEHGAGSFTAHWPAMTGWPWRPVSDDE